MNPLRDKVEISVEAGAYTLDPSQPFGGRLVLGEKSILRSTLEMAVDANGVPMVDNNDELSYWKMVQRSTAAD